MNPLQPDNPYQPPGVPSTRRPEPGRWTREEIYETVAQVLVEALGVDRSEITPDASLVKDLGAE